ncbi:hypothetical protein BJ138DRAFT_1124548 [Hygrophoropsis aurantiaca]|uniref:Uncharacterized protein n=1 Tax=Hygrophoropsis aurantiaca TaxID=72124 RepID=A0ACB8AJN2_9AGAM|nr:hypothetical protein BJ138DRAFT_1124548 [Hygrophoropsis aurantiaca]
MSHKSIGNRLARWIRDLNQAYSMYCSSFILGFDAWAPIKSNAKLPSILESLSASDPLSPDTAKMLDIGDISTWTLDTLILLPKSRLRYIKSIYTPFLKKGQGGIVNHPGVSDGLLKLDALITILDERGRYRVGEPLLASSPIAGTEQILSNRSEGSLSNSLLDMELAPRPVVEPPAEIPTKSRRTVHRGPSYDSLLDMPAIGPLKSNDRTDIGEVERVSAPVVSPVQSSMPDKSPRTLPPKSEVPKEYADGAANSPPSKPTKGQFSVRLWSNLRRKMPRMRINRVDTVSTAKTKQRVAGRQQTQDTTASNETTDDESDGGHAPRANRVRGGGNDYGNHDDESEIALVDICCFCLCFKSRR